MLAALLFILWAYGMYALVSTLRGRRAGALRRGRPWRRLGWLGLLAGAGVGLVLAWALVQSFEGRHQDLQLAGFQGTVWAEGVPANLNSRVEEPPIKATASGDQPVYSLLHPGTSCRRFGPEDDDPQAQAGPQAQNPQSPGRQRDQGPGPEPAGGRQG